MNIYVMSLIMGTSALLFGRNRQDVLTKTSPSTRDGSMWDDGDLVLEDLYKVSGKPLTQISCSRRNYICVWEHNSLLNATVSGKRSCCGMTIGECICTTLANIHFHKIDHDDIASIRTIAAGHKLLLETCQKRAIDTRCSYICLCLHGWRLPYLQNSTQCGTRSRIFICENHTQQMREREHDRVSKETGIHKGYRYQEGENNNIIKEVLNSHIKNFDLAKERKQYIDLPYREGNDEKSNHSAPIILSIGEATEVLRGGLCFQPLDLVDAPNTTTLVESKSQLGYRGFQTRISSRELKIKTRYATNKMKDGGRASDSSVPYVRKTGQRFKREMHIMMARYRHESTGPVKMKKTKTTTRPPKQKGDLMSSTTPQTFLNVSFTGYWDRDSSKTTVKPKRVKNPLMITDQDNEFVHGKNWKNKQKETKEKGKNSKSKSDSSFPGGWTSPL